MEMFGTISAWVMENMPALAMIAMALVTAAEAFTTFTESPNDDKVVKKVKNTVVNLTKRFVPGWEQKKPPVDG